MISSRLLENLEYFWLLLFLPHWFDQRNRRPCRLSSARLVDIARRSNKILDSSIAFSRLLMHIERCGIRCLKLGVTFGCWLHVCTLLCTSAHVEPGMCMRSMYRWWVDKHRCIVQSTAYLVSLCRQFGR